MSVTCQQITKQETANVDHSVPGVKTQMRGLAGNHTLIGEHFLQRKCACGSQGGKCDCKKPDEGMVQRAVQTKLAVNEAGDRYEQEADRVADQVLAPPFAAVESTPPRIQRFAGNSAGSTTAPSSVDKVLSSPGRPLGSTLQRTMEQRFGHDFSHVRVHSGAAAEASACEVNSHAYTVGHDIVFGAGRFAPATHEGQRLIAHELTHVVQQSGATGRSKANSIQRKVVDDDEHVTCRSTRDNSVSDLIAAENKAADLADRAAAAIRAHPPAERTHNCMWSRFRRNYNDPRDRCRFIPEIADRFSEIAREIRSTECTYVCTEVSEPSDRCNGHFAFTHPRILNDPKMDLCDRFWRNPNEQANTLLHEWAHHVYRFQGLEDEPLSGFDMAECYANFATEIAGGKVAVFGDVIPCEPKRDPPALNQARLRLPCPGNVFLNISALGGGAAGIPGSRSYVGIGVDYLFPITGMHELELAVGARFREFGASPNPEDWTNYQIGAQVGFAWRKQPHRFGRQLGGFLEFGRISESEETGKARTYGAAGLSGGVNLRIGQETAMRILLEAGVGRALATETERGFWFLHAGLSFGFSFEGL